MLPPITPLSFDSLLESLPEINSTVFDEMYIYCTPTGILAHNMGRTGEKTEQQLAVNLGFARVQNCPHGKRAGRFSGQLKASSSFLRAPGDHGLNRIIILVCGLAEIGVEAEVPDAHGEVVSTGVTVLLLPDAAAFDQTAAWRSAENTVWGAIGLSLVTGSTVMSMSKVRVEIEPTPLAVSMSALSNLMQLVVIALLLFWCCNDGHPARAKDLNTPLAERSGEG